MPYISNKAAFPVKWIVNLKNISNKASNAISNEVWFSCEMAGRIVSSDVAFFHYLLKCFLQRKNIPTPGIKWTAPNIQQMLSAVI